MTQIDIANILHCSQRVYSNYERGDIDIPTDILIALADFHNVSVDYLLGRTDGPEVSQYPRIKALREEKGQTQDDIAKMLGCSRHAYSNYEYGYLDIPAGILIRLSDFYHADVDYLLGRTDSRARD